METRASQAEMLSAILFRIRGVLRRFWWIPLICATIGLGIGAILAGRDQTLYQSSARMMVSGRVNVTEGNAYSEEASNFFGTQIELMRSSQVLEQAEGRIKANGRIPSAKLSSLDIDILKGTSIFMLRATGETPEYTQAFLDAVIQEYIALKRGMRAQTSENALSAITDELLRLEKEWRDGEEELAAFQKQHSLVFLKEGENTAAKYLAGLNERLASLSTQKRLFEELNFDQLRGLQTRNQPAQPNGEAAAAKEDRTPDFVAQVEYLKARQQLELLEKKREGLLETLREGHQDVLAVNEEIAAQKRVLALAREQSAAEFELHRQSIDAQIKALEEEVNVWKTKALEIGKLIGDYGRIQAKVDRSKGLYDRLLSNVGTVGLTKNMEQDIVSVLDRPSSAHAVRPGMAQKLTSGAMCGLLVGALILFLLDRSNAQIASPEEFVANFSERILGIVPGVANAEERLQVSDSRHAFAESFYNIRSSLFFLPYDGPMPKTLLITSSVPNEGKSTLSANVAHSFAFAGSKTLLIDGDLRRGALHSKFGLENERGFSDVLQRKVPWADVVVATDTPNLFVMPRGSLIAQPSKYLVHSSTDALLRELYDQFDQIIIDSCPVLAADDTTSFAPKVEAVLFVARIGRATRRNVATSLTSLASRQANVLGVILNGVDTSLTAYTYYDYTSYYTDAPAGTSRGKAVSA